MNASMCSQIETITIYPEQASAHIGLRDNILLGSPSFCLDGLPNVKSSRFWQGHLKHENSCPAGEWDNQPIAHWLYYLCGVCITLSDAAPWSLNQFPTIRLFGVTCAQGCLYFSWHSQDSTQLKSIVSSVNRLRIMKLADCRRLLPYCQAISFFSSGFSPDTLLW